MDDVTVDIGEAHVAAAVAEGELGVVEAEKVEHGGVEVVDFDSGIYFLTNVLAGGRGFAACFSHYVSLHPLRSLVR